MSDLPALRRLQRLWATLVLVLVGIGVSLLFLDVEPTDLPPALPAALAGAAGAATVVAIIAIDRMFAASAPQDDDRALREYQARQTLQFAISESPALLGFALAYVFGTLMAAWVGLGLALLALIRARPSQPRLAALERTWQANGHDVSVLRAAATPQVSEG